MSTLAQQPIPTATVTLDHQRTVVFDFRTLERIEEGCGSTCAQILSDVIDTKDGRPVVLYARLSARLMTRFIAAATGIEHADLGKVLPLAQTRKVFMGLIPAFADAVTQMLGLGEKPAEGEAEDESPLPETGAGSPASGPGPSSSSG